MTTIFVYRNHKIELYKNFYNKYIYKVYNAELGLVYVSDELATEEKAKAASKQYIDRAIKREYY
jgi:hypothetical protein